MELFKGITWAVGGGKGGVGKSLIASALAGALARNGRRVILVDADLAGANLHTYLGIRYPERTLHDFLKKKVGRFEDVILPTSVDNLSLICGATDILELANPKFAQKQKLIRAISGLRADFVVIDIGAGSTLNNLDFFNTADVGILVTSPTPASMQTAYSFLKMALSRRFQALFADYPEIRECIAGGLEDSSRGKNIPDIIRAVKEIDEAQSWNMIKFLVGMRYRLVVNMADPAEGERVSNAMAGVAYQFLRLKLHSAGSIGFSPDLEAAVRRMSPAGIFGNASLSRAVHSIISRIGVERQQGSPPAIPEVPAAGRAPEPADSIARERGSGVQVCLNDEITYEGVRLHVQTEDLGVEKSRILTLVFRGGSILFLKDSAYQELMQGDADLQTIGDRVRRQHRTIIAGIQAGRLREKIAASGDRP